MKKKDSRLKKPSDFKRVFKEGRRFSSPHFVLYVRESELPTARLGVSIAKRHFRLATRRNKIRRVAKELFRKELSARPKKRDFVVASRASYPERNIKEALEEIRYLITRPENR